MNTNRYRFSAANDFFVPNKTLYRDYVEFIKVRSPRTALRRPYWPLSNLATLTKWYRNIGLEKTYF